MQKTVPVLVGVVLQASTIIGGREGVLRGHSSRDLAGQRGMEGGDARGGVGLVDGDGGDREDP